MSPTFTYVVLYLHQVALKSITTAFPSAEAFIMISSTSVKVVGSSTAPPLMDKVVSRLGTSLEKAGVLGAAAQKRFSLHDFFSGKIEFAATREATDARVTVTKENFILNYNERVQEQYCFS